MNNVTITGRLTDTVKVKQTNTGKQVLNFSIAVNDYSGNKERVNYFDFVAFDKPNLVPYLLKGPLVGITGRLRQNRWETQDGSKRSKVEIVANNIELLGKAKEQTEQPQTQTQPMTGIVTEPTLYDADIPF